MVMPNVTFYYDLVCPFAYSASILIERVAAKYSCIVEWKPVLLGGIYDLTGAPQGKNGSASDAMNMNKNQIISNDLNLTIKRYKIPYNPPTKPPKTLFGIKEY